MVSLTAEELHDILNFTVDIAHKAGDLILEGSVAIQTASSLGEKTNSVDLVTEYDVRVEELVKTELASKYPSFGL
jgi:myo-inositol-1(or 4)-monophosphatase